MNGVFLLESKIENYSLFHHVDKITFGDKLNLDKQFIIKVNEFYTFYESMRHLFVSIKEHLLKKSLIFINEDNGSSYFWEVVKIFNETQEKDEFAIKFFIRNSLNNVIYILLLSEKHLLFLIKAFCKNIISCLSIDNVSKLWLKHCSTFNLTELQNNYFEIYSMAELFTIRFQNQDKTFYFVELFDYYFLTILAYKNFSLFL